MVSCPNYTSAGQAVVVLYRQVGLYTNIDLRFFVIVAVSHLWRETFEQVGGHHNVSCSISSVIQPGHSGWSL